MFPNAFLSSLNQTISLKGNWAHTKRVVHVVTTVELAIAIHNEHVSITIAAIKPIRRQNLPTIRLTLLIITYLISFFLMK